MHHLNDGHLAEIQNGIAAPVLADHTPIFVIRLDFFKQGAAGGLQHIAMHLLLHTAWVDHQAGVVPDHHPLDMHFAGFLMHFDIGHPRRPSRTKARPLAVHIAGIGHALPLQPVSQHGLLLGLLMHPPARAIGSGLQQCFGTRVTEHVQAVLQGVGIRSDSQLVNKALVRK